MDPITTAIIAAITAGATAGMTESAKQAMVDAYEGLKALLKKKFGTQSEVVKSVESLETRPDSSPRKNVLLEEVAAAKADQDTDLLHAAHVLLERISTQPDGGQHIQSASGSYIAQADRGSSAQVHVNQPRSEQ